MFLLWAFFARGLSGMNDAKSGQGAAQSTQEPLRTAQELPRRSKRAPGAAQDALRRPWEDPQRLPNLAKMMENSGLGKVSWSVVFRGAQEPPKDGQEP